MSCSLAEAITPEEREALRRLVASGVELTTPLPETHGIVLLSTRDSADRLPRNNLPRSMGQPQ